MVHVNQQDARALLRLTHNDDFKVLQRLLSEERAAYQKDVEATADIPLYRIQGRLAFIREIDELLTEIAPKIAR